MGKNFDLKDEDIEIFKKAASSQYSSTLYNQLKKDRRLDRFIEVLSVCGARNMSLTETCKVLTRHFPSYVRGKGLLPKTLAGMIEFYPDLEEAWSFNKELYELRAFKNASIIIDVTDSIDDIKKFHEMYSDGDFLYNKGGTEENVKSENTVGGVQVNVYTGEIDDDDQD